MACLCWAFRTEIEAKEQCLNCMQFSPKRARSRPGEDEAPVIYSYRNKWPLNTDTMGGCFEAHFWENTPPSCSLRCVRILSYKVSFPRPLGRSAFSWFLLPHFFPKYLSQLWDLIMMWSSHLSKLYTKVEIWTVVKDQGFEIRNAQLILHYLPGRWPVTIPYF